jgi:Protein of unknown function (DUF3179)
MTRLALGALFVLVLAACGGDGQSEAERISSVEEELSTLPEQGPGLGEAGPLPAITAGWKTDFTRRSVPLLEFSSGGPGKDGIPSIDAPRFVRVDEANFLEPKEPVIVLDVDGNVRAYPIQILVWHEIVNDVVGGIPVAVTFCPLCNTALAFDRRVEGDTLDFGTTGNLRNSDLVMYDRQTESWWQQFGGRALVGRHTGAILERVPARILAWRDFRSRFPRGRVLSRETEHSRPYGENPYVGYDDVESPPFFAGAHAGDDRLPPKERVVFVERGGEAVAISFTTLRKRRVVRVELGRSELVVRWRSGVASALDEDTVAKGRDVGAADGRENGKLVPFDEPFWFAVAAFRPGVRIIR